MVKSVFRIDSDYQDEDENTNTRDFEQVLSLSALWSETLWGKTADDANNGTKHEGSPLGTDLRVPW